jgi:hypothetical protein
MLENSMASKTALGFQVWVEKAQRMKFRDQRIVLLREVYYYIFVGENS